MKTILVVEDDRDLQKALNTKLQSSGFNVILSSNGKEALSIIVENKNIDLVLLDVVMPEMGGIELAGIMDEKVFRKIPIILLTNLPYTAYPLNVVDYLVKAQTSIDQVVEHINKALLSTDSS